MAARQIWFTIIQHFMAKLPHIDFTAGALQYRKKQVSLRKEALARALGLKTKAPKKIIDATAGAGRDSFILACLGFEVTLLERSPVIFDLLNQAIEHAKSQPDLQPILEKMHLQKADAIHWLAALDKNALPDIIYLDPMFPPRKKSAAVKKTMQQLHALVGEDNDADHLLQTALSCANERVVVKRSRLAKPLAALKPNLSLIGKSSRFDIYLINDKKRKSLHD